MYILQSEEAAAVMLLLLLDYFYWMCEEITRHFYLKFAQ